jgi:hypothetical protein
MSALTELKIKLDLIGGLGTITIGIMPATPDVMGCLQEYGGQSAERAFGVTGIKYENPAIQLLFRGAAFDYAGPRAKAEIAFKKLVEVQPGALCVGVTTEYLFIDPQQSPHPVAPVDANNRHYIGINFYIKKRLSSS